MKTKALLPLLLAVLISFSACTGKPSTEGEKGKEGENAKSPENTQYANGTSDQESKDLQIYENIAKKLQNYNQLLGEKKFTEIRTAMTEAKELAKELSEEKRKMVEESLKVGETQVNDLEAVAKRCPDTKQDELPKKGEKVAVITTSMGVVKAKLFTCDLPEITKNFTTLAEKKYYDGLQFHRIIKDFMIQGGDPKGDGTGGESYLGAGKPLKDEFSPSLNHKKGALSMANSGPNTNGSQFFIVQASEGTPWLDYKHAVFGQVFEGMEIVDKLAQVNVGENDKPVTPVTMEKVEIITQE
jgi:peptidyl-prolyl cis-trans isomerase B (cyclophilin B)